MRLFKKVSSEITVNAIANVPGAESISTSKVVDLRDASTWKFLDADFVGLTDAILESIQYMDGDEIVTLAPDGDVTLENYVLPLMKYPDAIYRYNYKSAFTNVNVHVYKDNEKQNETTVSFDLRDNSTWKFSTDKLSVTGATLHKIVLVTPGKNDNVDKTDILYNGPDAMNYLLDSTVLPLEEGQYFRCYFEDNNPDIKAEFYLLNDASKLNYSSTVADGATVISQDSEMVEFLGEITTKKMEDLLNVANLLDEEQLATIWGLTAENCNWLDKLNDPNIVLYEVRSDKCATYNDPGPRQGGQWIYASNNTNAKNYLDGVGQNHPVEDTDHKPGPVETSSLVITNKTGNTIQYLFIKKVPYDITYFVMNGKDNNIECATTTGDVAGTQIDIPDFKETYKNDEAIAKKLADNKSAALEDLIPHGIKVWIDGELQYNNDAGSEFWAPNSFYSLAGKEGEEYKIEVYYRQPDVAGKATIRLPVTMYDYDADGMFFEFCSNATNPNRLTESSYGFSMNLNPGEVGSKLVEVDLDRTSGSPRLKYTEKAITDIANLINTGKIWSGEDGQFAGDKNSERPATFPDMEIRTVMKGLQGKGGEYADIAKYMKDAGDTEITLQEVKDSKSTYVGAAFMMSNFFKDSDGYGERVDGIDALELREYTDAEGQTYFVYDAAWKSEVKEGVIRNVENENGYFTGAKERYELEGKNAPYKLLSSWYMPIDWLESTVEKVTVGETTEEFEKSTHNGDTFDQYDNANFLFTTVGEGSFVYESKKNLEFTFAGDDDVYLFINNKLVLDMGGAHSNLTHTLYLNEANANEDLNLNLKDGDMCTFTFFHMERHGTGSNFKMMTNINISAPETETHKYAYTLDGTTEKTENELPNGASIDPNKEYYYAFSLKNSGEVNMYNLAFWDLNTHVQLYPLGNTTGYKSTLNGTAKWADIILDISEQNANGEVVHKAITKYEFKQGEAPFEGWEPVIPDEQKNEANPEPNPIGSYGVIENISVSDLYKQVYGNAPTGDAEVAYQQLLEEIIRNGIKVGQKITVKGFAWHLGSANEFTNTVQTYGMTWDHREKTGSDTHNVVSRGANTVVKVIDYGKPVTYAFEEIFKTDINFQDILLMKGDPESENEDDYLAPHGNTYKTGYQWVNGENGEKGNLVKVEGENPNEILSESVLENGDGTGYYWMAGSSGKMDDLKFTFVPERIMDEMSKFGFKITRHLPPQEGVPHPTETYEKYLEIYPANVVYYEDNFTKPGSDDEYGIVFSGNVGYEGEDNVFEQDSNAGTIDNDDPRFNGDQQYGYDQNYDATSGSGDSNGTAVKMTNNGNITKAEFTFRGTGFDIVGRTSSSSTVVTYVVEDKETGYAVKFGIVDTLYTNGELYQIPVIHITDLPYSKYKVTLGVAKSAVDSGNPDSGRDTFYLDGIRIYNPMGTADTPYLPTEDDAQIQKLNSMILGDCTITEEGVVDKDGNIATGYVNAPGATAALVNADGQGLPLAYTEDMAAGEASSTESLLAVLSRGPNNEIYLDDLGAIAMIVEGNSEAADSTLQIEAKLVHVGGTAELTEPIFANMSYYNPGNTEAVEGYVSPADWRINTSTAMYYNVPKDALIPLEEAGKYLLVVRGGVASDEEHMISLTNMKSKGYKFYNPADAADENGKVADFLHFGEPKNDYLSRVDNVPERVLKNTYFEVDLIVGTDNYDAIFEAADKKNGFAVYSILSNEKPDKNTRVTYQVRKNDSDKELGIIHLRIRSPKAVGNFTLALEYTDETNKTETLSFGLNVTVRDKGEGKKK